MRRINGGARIYKKHKNPQAAGTGGHRNLGLVKSENDGAKQSSGAIPINWRNVGAVSRE